MATQFGEYEDEDSVLAPKEPQVTSQDPNERKAGRALRIKRRQDALKRAEQPLEEIVTEEEPNEIEKATTAAAEELQRLALDGAAKVTNVKVTTDEREVIRRGQLFAKMEKTLQNIEEEAAEAQLQYDVITANWETMMALKDPLDIDAEMKEQRRKCDALLKQKDELIAEVKNDLKKMDIAYYEDLEKQDKDIKELSDRVEKQLTIMQRAYGQQLFLIEQAIKIERDAMVDHNNKRWDALYKQRDKEEVIHLEYKFQQLEEQKLEIEAITWDHHEKYREAKIELETLIQELQQELEKLKATCIINTEKIGYNYQVLKKREEENVFVRSQQKRKLNKMSDVANNLRAKIRKAAEDGAIEEMRADAEIEKLIQTMSDLEKKSDQFSHVNHYKFSQVWRMAAARCAELARSLRRCEVALHAHVLAEPPPPPPPLHPVSPLAKYEHEDKEVTEGSTLEITNGLGPNSEVSRDAKDRLVRHILQLVADNTGFLVEDRLLRLIERYQLTSRNLCTLDSIFMALEIQAEEDIELLCKTFLKYAFCPTCASAEPAREASTSSPDQVQHLSGTRFSMHGKNTESEFRMVAESSELVVAQPSPFLCPDGHPLEIEPMQVLTALGEFISVFIPPDKKKLYDLLDSVKPPKFTTPSRKMMQVEIEQYWTKWKSMFSDEKNRFWDGLLKELNNYLPILQERERLHEEVTYLRRRNAALRRLIHGALPELPRALPKYAKPYPQKFIAPYPEMDTRLPPI